MTSTTLKPKSNFNSAFKQTFKKLLPNNIAFIIASTLLAVLAYIFIFDYYEYTRNSVYAEEIDFLNEALIVAGVGAVLCLLYSLSVSGKMFKEIYSKRACDFYFATPIKREEHYIANFLNGILMNTVCFIIPILLFISSVSAMSTKYVHFTIDMGKFLSSAVPMLLAVFAMFSAFVMCAVTSGKKMHYALLSLICIFSSSVVVEGIIMRLNTIWGVSITSDKFAAINPATNALMSALMYENKDKAILAVISIIEIIGMFTAGLIIFKRRKAEVAEVSLTGKVFPYFMLALVVLSGYMYVNSAGKNYITLITGIISAVIAALLFSAIFYKKAFTKATAITTACVCAVCTVFVSIVYFPSYDKFVKYIPQQDEIEYAELYGYDGLGVYTDSLTERLLFFEDLRYESHEYRPLKIEQADSLEKLLKLHEKLVDDNTIARSNKTNLYSQLDLFTGNYNYETTFDCRIVYTLKNGQKVERVYSATSSLVYNEFIALMRNYDVLSQLEMFNVDSSSVLACNYTKYSEDEKVVEDDIVLDDESGFEYDDAVKLSDFDEFKTLYIQEMLEFEDTDFVTAINSDFAVDSGFDYTSEDENSYNPYTSSYDSYESIDYVADLTIFTMSDTATEEQKEKIAKMSPDEIIKTYYSGVALDGAIESASYPIYKNQTKTLEYVDALIVK